MPTPAPAPARVAIVGEPACTVHQGTALPCPHCAPKVDRLADIAQYVGRTGMWSPGPEGLGVTVHVLDARHAYGRKDLKITPADGVGDTWVRLSSVSF